MWVFGPPLGQDGYILARMPFACLKSTTDGVVLLRVMDFIAWLKEHLLLGYRSN